MPREVIRPSVRDLEDSDVYDQLAFPDNPVSVTRTRPPQIGVRPQTTSQSRELKRLYIVTVVQCSGS